MTTDSPVRRSLSAILLGVLVGGGVFAALRWERCVERWNLRALESPELSVKALAALRLSRIGSESAIRGLVRAIRSDPTERACLSFLPLNAPNVQTCGGHWLSLPPMTYALYLAGPAMDSVLAEEIRAIPYGEGAPTLNLVRRSWEFDWTVDLQDPSKWDDWGD